MAVRPPFISHTWAQCVDTPANYVVVFLMSFLRLCFLAGLECLKFVVDSSRSLPRTVVWGNLVMVNDIRSDNLDVAGRRRW